MFGCFELFSLTGGLVALFLLFRAGRISWNQLRLFGILFVLGLAFLGLILGTMRRPHQERLIAFLLVSGFLIALVALIAWAVKRWLWPVIAGTRYCPPIGQLKDLLAERLPQRAQVWLAAHLESCKACQHRVEGLTAALPSWPGMAQKLSHKSPFPEPALQKVINRLKDAPEEEATRDEPVFAADLPLGFLQPTDKPGQLGRLERYEVLEEIGRGGMGVVLKAFDPSLHRIVAIKVLAPQLATSGAARKRFLREAKAAAAVTHDHIVTIHAVDEANGLPYLVMHYVAGQSLQDRIDKEGPLELTEILRIGMQTASGLAAAHGQGIVHRDIKPANILLEEGVQRVKITDFGLARAMDDASLTQSGFVAGSPLYMAPEQARGEALDPRADLFSLGSVLYTMCTGRPPFRASNTLAVLRRVSEEAPRPIREINPEIPEWLAAVVDKLHAKEPSERYQSAAEVVEVLGQHLAQLQHAAWVPPPRVPALAGGHVAEPGFPTSLTLCPACGASLHVPEKMVGSIVHCAECGKPFNVEQGSEVIQVARAVPPPFGSRPMVRRKVPSWVWIAAACCAALFLFVVLVAWMYFRAESASRAEVAARSVASSKAVAPAARNAPQAVARQTRGRTPTQDPFWKNALGWLPEDATLFGAIDLEKFDFPTLGDEMTQPFLRLLLPKTTAEKITPENLGRIQLHGVQLGYYEATKSEDAHAVVHLSGVAHEGQKRIVSTIRRNTGETVQIEELSKLRQANGPTPVYVSGPELPFALFLADDNSAYLGACFGRNADAARHRKVLEKAQAAAKIPAGYKPPWVQSALASLPPESCAIFLGVIPNEARKPLTETLKLRVCPRSFIISMQRVDSRVSLFLTLNVDKAADARMLRDDLEKSCKQAANLVQSRFPATGKEPQALAPLTTILRTLHWQTEGESVKTEVWIPDTYWQMLGKLAKLAAQP